MKLNLNAVYNTINQLFSEPVEVTDESLIEKFIKSEAGIEPPFYQYQPIDTKNVDALRTLAEKKLSDYLKQHPDNSMQLFLTNEVKTARQYQSYFPKFETDSQQKTYYFRLERWIEVLDYIQNLKGEPLNDIYLINSNFWEQEKTKLEFKGFQREIEKHGFFNVKAGTETVKFYTPYLTVVLTSIELPVKNSVTHEETIINSWEFLMTYIKGYKRGEQYFETEHKVSQDIFYGTGFKEYANDLHRFYFHEQHGSNKGWVYVKNAEPHILTHKEIEEIGYYSGLINKVEELIKKYPKKFAIFEKHELQTKQSATKAEQETPKIFEELFYNPEHAEPCLKILSELQPPVIDSINNYIGKAKGVFPLWVKVLKSHKPQPLIKHFKDSVYKDLLNQKVKGLELTEDASEFRKQYKRIENNKTELDIRTILSQYSQSGKLGK